jgi:hypothetical protein
VGDYQTAIDTPVARISTDAGETFGPLLTLATNGTIDSAEEGGRSRREKEEKGRGVASKQLRDFTVSS